MPRGYYYIRRSFQSDRNILWPSQKKGLEKLIENKSFVLCTPTGSGKTTIAELAILQGLFPNEINEDQFWVSQKPISLYLVPSRALAAEVESKLSRVFGKLEQRVIVTGLYGGNDWGPTDAWITANEPTVLICTYEKGEALIRFLGTFFVNRLSTIIIDEAHNMQYNGDKRTLLSADNRGLRLENLANRLITYVESMQCKIIALSAVIEDGGNAMAKWVTGSMDSEPVDAKYRSTRQLVGRLEWNRNGKYEVLYDILNGAGLQFRDGGSSNEVPFIREPFDDYPYEYIDGGPEKRARVYLFWAAYQLVSNGGRKRQSVLISVMQKIDDLADDLHSFISTNKSDLPNIFEIPFEADKLTLWQRSLKSCEDYFGTDSLEYQLLLSGIVIHHGSMPGLTARLFTELINQEIVHLVLATSTLSEGVNLPFQTVLIPTLRRSNDSITHDEFFNLVGRPGRPGISTEGRSLVLFEANSNDYSIKMAKENYFKMTREVSGRKEADDKTHKISPLGELLFQIRDGWSNITGTTDDISFYGWLEQVIPEIDSETLNGTDTHEAVDTLDGVLLAILCELDNMSTEEQVSLLNYEDMLQKIWTRSFAFFTEPSSNLQDVFVKRGIAIRKNIYPDRIERRMLYKTGMAPRFGRQLISRQEEITNSLIEGEAYVSWDRDKQYNYINDVVNLISDIKKFEMPAAVGRGKNAIPRNVILKWWLQADTVDYKVPTGKKVSAWIGYINNNINYKFTWGVGSVIALTQENLNTTLAAPLTLDTWEDIGLPWVVFWIKELITWGTLDPVVAFLLSRGVVTTRREGLEVAKEYYKTVKDEEHNEQLNASRIKAWAEGHKTSKGIQSNQHIDQIIVTQMRKSEKLLEKKWRVLPVTHENKLVWYDYAGYEMAKSEIPVGWSRENYSNFDFFLDAQKRRITRTRYI